MNPKVDWFFNKATPWQKAYGLLRIIVLESGLAEALKWGVPCYTFQQKNVVLIHGFKDYCALLFPKGALLHDTEGILIQQTKNVQAARQIRFTNLRQIKEMEPVLRTYLYQAIAVEEAGLAVPLKKTEEFNMPEEFRGQLNKNRFLKKAFDSLTPGRQRGYLLYFSSAKQAKTRIERIEKYIPEILKGKGLND